MLQDLRSFLESVTLVKEVADQPEVAETDGPAEGVSKACSKCGHEHEHGRYCPECGTKRQSVAKAWDESLHPRAANGRFKALEGKVDEETAEEGQKIKVGGDSPTDPSKISQLQNRLGIKRTGEYDKTTRNAVTRFQRRYGLQVDGIAGNQTRGTLDRLVRGNRKRREAADDVKKDVGYLIAKSNEEKRYTLGPLYVPNARDAHNEFTTEEELQKAVWDYVRRGNRTIRKQHRRGTAIGEVVELVTWPYESEVELAVPGQVAKSRKVTLPAGTVYVGVIWSERSWPEVKKGAITGYSLGGRGKRVPDAVSDEQLERMAKARGWNESEHPRDPKSGKFIEVGSRVSASFTYGVGGGAVAEGAGKGTVIDGPRPDNPNGIGSPPGEYWKVELDHSLPGARWTKTWIEADNLTLPDDGGKVPAVNELPDRPYEEYERGHKVANSRASGFHLDDGELDDGALDDYVNDLSDGQAMILFHDLARNDHMDVLAYIADNPEMPDTKRRDAEATMRLASTHPEDFQPKPFVDDFEGQVSPQGHKMTRVETAFQREFDKHSDNIEMLEGLLDDLDAEIADFSREGESGHKDRLRNLRDRIRVKIEDLESR